MASIVGTPTSGAVLIKECMSEQLKELRKMSDVTIEGCLSRKL